jgi:toxin FitB
VIFLDTNVVSEFLRERPDAAVLAWSDGVEREAICTASVVEAELRLGIERLPDGRRKRAFGRELEAFLGATFGDRVYPFSRAAARFYARFMAERAKVGRPVSSPDALIAATARAHGATLLATRNTRDFEGCGVALVNPWDGP